MAGGRCRDCLLWSPLHYDDLLDESVCGRTIDRRTGSEDGCRDFRDNFLARLWPRMIEETRHGN